MVKLVEFCGFSVTMRCQLPHGDLETLISIKSDEDLANIIEEYVRASSNQKIRAVLSPPKSLKQVSSPESTAPSVDNKSTVSDSGQTSHHTGELYGRRSRSPARRLPVRFNADAGKLSFINPRYYARGGPTVFSGAPCCCNYSARHPEKDVQRNLRIN